jgi:hypothetical protein
MAAALFDTHAFVKRLTAVGMPEAQAEVLADEQARRVDERLATKADVAELATKADLREVELRLDAKIQVTTEALKSEIIKWMFGTIGFQTLVILGAVIALAKQFH